MMAKKRKSDLARINLGRRNYRRLWLIALLALFSLIFSQDAYAYLDPGTGSYLLQVGLAVLVGASFAIKIYWRRIRGAFANLFSKRKKDGKNSH